MQRKMTRAAPDFVSIDYRLDVTGFEVRMSNQMQTLKNKKPTFNLTRLASVAKNRMTVGECRRFDISAAKTGSTRCGLTCVLFSSTCAEWGSTQLSRADYYEDSQNTSNPFKDDKLQATLHQSYHHGT